MSNSIQFINVAAMLHKSRINTRNNNDMLSYSLATMICNLTKE